MSDAKFFEVVIQEPITMPATSTSNPEILYSGCDFLNEWVIRSEGMRKDEHLDHRFEWEDKIEAMKRRVADRLGVTAPELPKMTGKEDADQALAESYQQAAKAYSEAMAKGTTGEILYISDAAYTAGIDSAKAQIDKACGAERTLNTLHEPKVLRLYHRMRTKSRALRENEIPSSDVDQAQPSS